MLEVVGLGVSRTGTASLRTALGLLGYGPCYHVSEIVRWPHLALRWRRYEAIGAQALPAALHGYRSACDVPIYAYWRSIVERWPDGRCILTIRDSSSWYDSVRATILPILLGVPMPTLPGNEFAHGICRDVFMREFMGGVAFSRSAAIRRYEAHNEEVRRSLSNDRLLVMSVGDGWAPLCRFLGVDEPSVPFPHCNRSETLLRDVPFLRAWQRESIRYD